MEHLILYHVSKSYDDSYTLLILALAGKIDLS